MGLARDLTMGSKRPRRSTIASGPAWTRLRALTAAPSPDPEALAEAIHVVAAQPGRMRFAEGAQYNDACRKYRNLTGQDIGPATGTY
jgi:hypothetical protein